MFSLGKITAGRHMEADLLIIGGGVAGCVAALKAAEAGIKVVLWEKAGILRSGSASAGIRNMRGFLPPGVSHGEVAESIASGGGFLGGNAAMLKGLVDENIIYTGYRESWDALKDLARWGVDLLGAPDEHRLSYDSRTGANTILYFRGGKEFKKNLARKVLSARVETLERTMGLDLLTQGNSVVGATGINIRNGGFVVCRAKATFLSTGSAMRVYHPREGIPSGKFKMLYSHVGAGDGIAMAFRAGAELINMELVSEGGGGAIITSSPYDRLCTRTGHLLGDRTRAPVVNARGEKIGEGRIPIERIMEEEQAGRGPCFIDAAGLSEEVHKKIEGARKETSDILAVFARERGLDARTHKYELVSFKGDRIAYPLAGVMIDAHTRTSLKGLYAGGDTIGGTNFGGAAGAVVFGRKAGMAAAEDMAGLPAPVLEEKQVMHSRRMVLAPLGRKEGVLPLELELKVRDITDRYCGAHRSEGKIKQGLWRLQSVGENFLPELRARDFHEVMNAQEVRNIILLAEVHMRSALERRESCSGNWRVDLPERRDAAWQAGIAARKEGADTVIYRRVMPSLCHITASHKRGGT